MFTTQNGNIVCGGGATGAPNNPITVRNDTPAGGTTRDVIAGQFVLGLPCLASGVTDSVLLALSGPNTSWNDIAPSAAKWTDPDLDVAQLVVSRFDGTRLFIFNLTPVSAAALTPVPIPAAAPLFLLGLAGLLRTRARR